MSDQRLGPVVCFSYLAAAELWKVARFPLANYGAEVVNVEHSIAADAPMTAAVLAALDTPALLLSNSIGNDVRGAEVRRWLQCHQVPSAGEVTGELDTPQIVVAADESGTRTWFPYLPGVIDGLAALDLSPLIDARFAYVDCYQLIEVPAVRVIRVAQSAGIPLLLNLGGSPLSALVTAAVRGYPGLVVQTNVDDDRHAETLKVAESLLAATDAEWVVITAGAYGAVAVSRTESLSVPAFRAVVRHTHCAGAAFSGGLLYGLLEGKSMADSLTLASASGALRCERGHQEPMPTISELRSFIETREHLDAAA